MRYEPYVCSFSVVSAYFTTVGLGEVGSVNTEASCVDIA